MELSSLFPITKDLVITTAQGDSTDLLFKVVGHDSKQFRAVAKKYAQQFLGVDKIPVDELERQNAELLAACIIGWNNLTEGGVPVPYTHEKAVELMMTPELSFIREQVERYVAQRVNFFRRDTEEAV